VDDLRCLIFIPTYNEAENVEPLYRRIQALGLDMDYLFLDDNSPDGTGQLIDRLAGENSRVHTIHRPGKLGIGSAHRQGIRWAHQHGYDVLVTLDCDFTHSPELIPLFLECSYEHDVVVGSRYLSKNSLVGWSVLRRFLTKVGHFLTTRLLRMPHDATGAFRVYRLDRIPDGVFDAVYSRSYSFFFESLYVLWLNNYRIKELPISLPARTYGHSKMAWRDAAYSSLLLAYLCAKTLINRKAFLYAEPVAPTETVSKTQIEASWDEYWLAKSQPAPLIYELIAAFYRRFIIRPALNHYTGLCFAPGSKVLHAGCGGGEVDIDASHKYLVSAMDISVPALSLYRKHNGPGSQVIHGSVFSIPTAECAYDGVYNAGVMEHFTEKEIKSALDEFYRVLKPDGKLLLFWPPSYGVTVRFLGALHYVLRDVLKKDIKLHPDEITHVRSRNQVNEYLRNSGFALDRFSFGIRDLFTQVVIVARKAEAASCLELLPSEQRTVAQRRAQAS
jgi:dolichol-phosphate mannosyltransferase